MSLPCYLTKGVEFIILIVRYTSTVLSFIYILALQSVSLWTAFSFRNHVRRGALLVAGLLTLLVSLSIVSRSLFSRISLSIGCCLRIPSHCHALPHYRPYFRSLRFTQWREVSCLVLCFPYCSRVCGRRNDSEPQRSGNVRHRFVGRTTWKEGGHSTFCSRLSGYHSRWGHNILLQRSNWISTTMCAHFYQGSSAFCEVLIIIYQLSRYLLKCFHFFRHCCAPLHIMCIAS